MFVCVFWAGLLCMPAGPLYFNGMYHIFYQYNRDGAFWGNMSWGHSVSSDLVHWKFLGCNLEPSEWYDIHGAWSGSITMLNGVPTALYTGKLPRSLALQALLRIQELLVPLWLIPLVDDVSPCGKSCLTSPPPRVDYKR